MPIESRLTLELGADDFVNHACAEALMQGALTGGPFVSDQRMMRSYSPFGHSTRSRPFGIDSAPYFTAFVLNSCRTVAIACAD